jgi:hypothetical protein
LQPHDACQGVIAGHAKVLLLGMPRCYCWACQSTIGGLAKYYINCSTNTLTAPESKYEYMCITRNYVLLLVRELSEGLDLSTHCSIRGNGCADRCVHIVPPPNTRQKIVHSGNSFNHVYTKHTEYLEDLNPTPKSLTVYNVHTSPQRPR